MDMKGEKPWYKRLCMIDETVGLHENLSFWFALVLPFLISLLLVGLFAYQLYEEGKHDFVFTQSSITAFIKYFTFPISLLSLSVVFGVMVARFHSSKQRAVSNDVALRNNSVNYFYKTHEEFEKYCSKLADSKKYDLKVIRADVCYSKLFSSSTPEAPSLLVGESFYGDIKAIYSIYANNFIKYLGSEKFHKDQSSKPGVKIRPKYDFSEGLSNRFERLGIEMSWLGYTGDLKNAEKNLGVFYNSVYELFLFPGLENREASIEKINAIHLEWTNFIKSDSKYIELVDLQTPQS